MKTVHKVLLIIAISVVYFPVAGHDFLYFWDDQWVVMNRYTEGGFTFGNLWAIFTEFYHGQYAPLNELLYLIVYSFSGYNPVYFHLASILIHTLNTLLVYACIEKLLLINTKIKAEHPGLIAFITALLFAIHPLNVESVAWMSASKILVYSFYYLLATYCFLLYINHKKVRYYVFTLLLFICSFLGKEQAVTFPLWMLLIYWLTGYPFDDKKLWLRTTPFFLLSLFFGVITMLSQSAAGGGALSAESSYPIWQRVVYACYSFVEYLFKCIFPFKLSYLYPFPSVIGEALPMWLLFYPTLLMLVVVAFRKKILNNQILFFSLIFFLIHIAVALHIIPLSRFAVVADRYVYISSVGVCFALSCGIVYLLNKYQRRGKTIVSILFGCYVLYLGIYANIRSRAWYDTDTLKHEIREILQEREDYNRGNDPIEETKEESK